MDCCCCMFCVIFESRLSVHLVTCTSASASTSVLLFALPVKRRRRTARVTRLSSSSLSDRNRVAQLQCNYSADDGCSVAAPAASVPLVKERDAMTSNRIHSQKKDRFFLFSSFFLLFFSWILSVYSCEIYWLAGERNGCAGR